MTRGDGGCPGWWRKRESTCSGRYWRDKLKRRGVGFYRRETGGGSDGGGGVVLLLEPQLFAVVAVVVGVPTQAKFKLKRGIT
jgi:hypothetical protein